MLQNSSDKSAVLKEIIEGRKSIFPKDYIVEDISEEVLNEILHSANFAPTHKRTKPWRFKVHRGDQKNLLGEKLAEIYKNTVAPEAFLEKKYQSITEKVNRTPVIVTISINFSGMVPEWEEIAATAMAVQNMYLTCTAHNIGCYWSSPGMIKHLDDFLALDDNQKCYGLFYMGKV